MTKALLRRLGAFAAAANMIERQPWEWQAEAVRRLSGIVRQRPEKLPPELAPWVAERRAEAELAVRRAAAILLRDAVRLAQRKVVQPGVEATVFSGAAEYEILEQISPELLYILALGPKRNLRCALRDASALLPHGELWQTPFESDWRSLGRPPPPKNPHYPGPKIVSLGALQRRERARHGRAGVKRREAERMAAAQAQSPAANRATSPSDERA